MLEEDPHHLNFATQIYANSDLYIQTYIKVILKLSAAVEFRDNKIYIKVKLNNILMKKGENTL